MNCNVKHVVHDGAGLMALQILAFLSWLSYPRFDELSSRGLVIRSGVGGWFVFPLGYFKTMQDEVPPHTTRKDDTSSGGLVILARWIRMIMMRF